MNRLHILLLLTFLAGAPGWAQDAETESTDSDEVAEEQARMEEALERNAGASAELTVTLEALLPDAAIAVPLQARTKASVPPG